MQNTIIDELGNDRGEDVSRANQDPGWASALMVRISIV